MARFDRMTVLNMMLDLGLVPVFYHGDVEVARKVVAACAEGGARVVEFTNRGDFAPAVFLEVAQHLAREKSDVILGVGSVVDAPTAALYIGYGANFVVGPSLNPEVARLCNRRKVAYLPGCGTVSEIAQAEELGAEIVKIFPGSTLGGPNFVKAVLAPCPWTKIMPTGGVEATEENIRAWFKAGVACVGMGSNLITKEALASGDFASISRKVAQVLGWIRTARERGLFLGVEHVGLYPFRGVSGQEIAAWYGETFGLKVTEGSSSLFVEGTGRGRLEIMKQGETDRCHIAVQVADFEAAVAAMQAKGIELEEPVIRPGSKLVYLKQTDPAGNRVHLFWRK